nr:DNA (cytosine-5-)-methyltransferase [Hydrogenophaga aromaticivorans]
MNPQFILPIASELVVDLFAGGGGASTGIEQAIGRHVDIAINHDPEAISLHEANHPQTRHFVSDVFEVDPLVVCGDQPVGLLWASPDCKHFSKAKGGKPVSKKIRSLAWVVVKWAAAVKPRVICLENVEEFQTWGPLGVDDRPCPDRKGQTFQRWKRQLERMGYVVEHRELRACDHGAPTIRKRLFLVARRDGMPIVWPGSTHGAPDSLPVKQKKLKPWRTAAECIDWSVPAPSIFERSKPLADATCRRIAKGIMRYVVNAADPFIVTNTTGHPGAMITEPLRTITTGGHHALVAPTLVQTGYGEREGQAPRALDLGKPLGTVVAGQKHALVSAFLAKHYTGVVGSALPDPMGTATTVDHHSLVAAHLVHYHADKRPGDVRASDLREPIKTQTTENRHALVSAHMVTIDNNSSQGGHTPITEPLKTTVTENRHAVVTSHMLKLRGDNVGSGTDEPLHTISAQGTHHAEVRAFLIKYYGTDQDPALREPLHTVTTKDRFGLVTIKGIDYAIVDIGLRMLTPRELYRAQGFPEAYRIEHGADGRALTKTAQVRMCGNSVCPPLASAIVGANYHAIEFIRKAA